MQKVIYTVENQVAKVTLNRPSLHNAFDEEVISDLIKCFDDAQINQDVRVLILQSEGKTFSAGADLQWMQKMAGYTHAENLADAKNLALMLHKLFTLKKPTIARIQGAAFGGAVGLIACCDIAIASKLSKYCLSEVKLGLLPATISPYVINAVGARYAKRLFMTAEVISARRARRIGLISETVSEEELDEEINAIVDKILKNGPNAVSLSKSLVNEIQHLPINNNLMDMTSHTIANARTSVEGQEGIQAFLQKRSPNWVNKDD
ncbi:enoyl-CoA hydratase/isomerase family protein [Glaciecola petra]|uniref:Enoyl-CoA hydratase/isomerase family protein n=1 Tax=Glaciecola petra TaxID=3075602 RepID=A0ABU2ZRX2_9ALTE|nr:enoyl-CoA hydratase/isomerase family protein [Aestuariibacter sp. P117]MDT0594187.1 enoyl-CoA hydratase/isomerase family protein [Aestuariibacter sp. P117]